MDHVLCADVEPTAPLTPDERSDLIRIGWDHEIALCPGYSRKFRATDMGTDSFSRGYHFCLFCRVDLVRSIRRHVVGVLRDSWQRPPMAGRSARRDGACRRGFIRDMLLARRSRRCGKRDGGELVKELPAP